MPVVRTLVAVLGILVMVCVMGPILMDQHYIIPQRKMHQSTKNTSERAKEHQPERDRKKTKAKKTRRTKKMPRCELGPDDDPLEAAQALAAVDHVEDAKMCLVPYLHAHPDSSQGWGMLSILEEAMGNMTAAIEAKVKYLVALKAPPVQSSLGLRDDAEGKHTRRAMFLQELTDLAEWHEESSDYTHAADVYESVLDLVTSQHHYHRVFSRLASARQQALTDFDRAERRARSRKAADEDERMAAKTPSKKESSQASQIDTAWLSRASDGGVQTVSVWAGPGGSQHARVLSPVQARSSSTAFRPSTLPSLAGEDAGRVHSPVFVRRGRRWLLFFLQEEDRQEEEKNRATHAVDGESVRPQDAIQTRVHMWSAETDSADGMSGWTKPQRVSSVSGKVGTLDDVASSRALWKRGGAAVSLAVFNGDGDSGSDGSLHMLVSQREASSAAWRVAWYVSGDAHTWIQVGPLSGLSFHHEHDQGQKIGDFYLVQPPGEEGRQRGDEGSGKRGAAQGCLRSLPIGACGFAVSSSPSEPGFSLFFSSLSAACPSAPHCYGGVLGRATSATMAGPWTLHPPAAPAPLSPPPVIDTQTDMTSLDNMLPFPRPDFSTHSLFRTLNRAHVVRRTRHDGPTNTHTFFLFFSCPFRHVHPAVAAAVFRAKERQLVDSDMYFLVSNQAEGPYISPFANDQNLVGLVRSDNERGVDVREFTLMMVDGSDGSDGSDGGVVVWGRRTGEVAARPLGQLRWGERVGDVWLEGMGSSVLPKAEL